MVIPCGLQINTCEGVKARQRCVLFQTLYCWYWLPYSCKVTHVLMLAACCRLHGHSICLAPAYLHVKNINRSTHFTNRYILQMTSIYYVLFLVMIWKWRGCWLPPIKFGWKIIYIYAICKGNMAMAPYVSLNINMRRCLWLCIWLSCSWGKRLS